MSETVKVFEQKMKDLLSFAKKNKGIIEVDKVNDFFKKTNKENKFKMTKSKNVVCDVFDITIGEECSTIVVTLSKVTDEMFGL